jgi:adenosylhomocysteine nucleosidase
VSERSCRAIVLFALKREAEPLIAHPQLQPAWLEQYQTFAFVQSLPDPADFIEPGTDDVIIDFSGVGTARAADTFDCLLKHFPNPGLVIAAGYCGALSVDSKVGDIAVPMEVVDESKQCWPCRYLPEIPWSGRLLTASRLIGDPGEKTVLAERYLADYVDMESAAIARICAERGLHFAAIRAVSDMSDTALSPELVRLLSGGDVSVWKACKALVRKPRLFREFLRLAKDTKLAARNLAETLVKVIGVPSRIADDH